LIFLKKWERLIDLQPEEYPFIKTKKEGDRMSEQYEVLSPWAEADAVPLHGITPRLDSMKGKKIGLFHHTKIAGPCITAAVEKLLRERYPDMQFNYFRFSRTGDLDDREDRIGAAMGDPKEEAEELERYEKWVKEVDAVIAAVGD
jgi:hypothetical protein